VRTKFEGKVDIILEDQELTEFKKRLTLRSHAITEESSVGVSLFLEKPSFSVIEISDFYDVRSEGNLSLNGKTTMYRSSLVRRTWSRKCSSHIPSDSDQCAMIGPSSSS
jgi:hypothetical protein